MKYAIAHPFLALGKKGTLLSAEETHMTPAKLAEAVTAGLFIEVEEGEPGDPTKADLQTQAKLLGIRGRSRMSHDELVEAIAAVNASDGAASSED